MVVEISCEAERCRFNQDGKCTSASIIVKKPILGFPKCWSYDIKKEKGREREKNMIKVSCDAEKCIFNQKRECTAEGIVIEKPIVGKPRCWSYASR